MAETRSFYKPVAGHEYVIGITHPAGGTMKAEGEYWLDDSHTWMMVRDGVIELTDAPQVESPSAGPEGMFKEDKTSGFK